MLPRDAPEDSAPADEPDARLVHHGARDAVGHGGHMEGKDHAEREEDLGGDGRRTELLLKLVLNDYSITTKYTSTELK